MVIYTKCTGYFIKEVIGKIGMIMKMDGILSLWNMTETVSTNNGYFLMLLDIKNKIINGSILIFRVLNLLYMKHLIFI